LDSRMPKHHPKSAHAHGRKHGERAEPKRRKARPTKPIESLAAVSQQKDKVQEAEVKTEGKTGEQTRWGEIDAGKRWQWQPHKPNLTKEEEKTMENVLKMASSVMGQEMDIGGSKMKFKERLDLVAKDEEINDGLDVGSKSEVASKDDDAVLKAAVEKVSESYDADTAIAQGFGVTSELLQKIDNQKSTPEVSDDLTVFEGDMLAGDPLKTELLQDDSARRASMAGTPWTTGPIPFCFASDVHAEIMIVFLKAVAHYERLVPCLQFQHVKHRRGKSEDPVAHQKCEAPSALFVTSKHGKGCHSYVGMQEGTKDDHVVTPIQLSPDGCNSLGIAVHELGHALAMIHEQAHPDRDNFVKVNWANVKEGKENNFAKANTEEFPGSSPFDPNSVMMFGSDFFSKEPGKPTLELKPDCNAGPRLLGQRMGLTQQDAAMVAKAYNCAAAQECPGSAVEAFAAEGACATNCVCYANGMAMIKQTDSSGCQTCQRSCPSDGNTCTTDASCACPKGMVREGEQADDSTPCYSCHLPQITGTDTEVSMTDKMTKLLSDGMPFDDIIDAIKTSFAKEEPDTVTIQRDPGHIKVTIEEKGGKVTTREGSWEPGAGVKG